MPIFSLPSMYGIGDFGTEAYNFIDFLQKANQKIWEILPLVQTGFSNSPYSSVCSNSFSIYYISPEFLYNDGLITKKELSKTKIKTKYVDYGFLYTTREYLLRKAFSRFDREDKEFSIYLKSKKSFDFALFTSIKLFENQKPFYEWREEFKFRNKKAINKFTSEHEEEILFWQFTQFIAEKQWFSLKKYANGKGVKIFGDLPLYVSADSVDVWRNPELFKLNSDLTPKKVAGVPPDYFSQDGQLWGNPVYDYLRHKEQNFSWWQKRVKSALKIFDLVRIDHFRGLDRYYEIDCNEKTAKNGIWVDVPSEELIRQIHKVVDKNKIIAEDLGIIDDGVKNLLKESGYPGMKILSFAFNNDNCNPYLPENIEENSVCFTGTHDNDTLLSLINKTEEKENLVSQVKYCLKKAKIIRKINGVKSLANSIIELGFYCKAKLFIIPIWDLFLKDSDYRINEPGTVKEENWSIIFDKKDFTDKKAEHLLKLSSKYNRN